MIVASACAHRLWSPDMHCLQCMQLPEVPPTPTPPPAAEDKRRPAELNINRHHQSIHAAFHLDVHVRPSTLHAALYNRPRTRTPPTVKPCGAFQHDRVFGITARCRRKSKLEIR